VHPITSSGQTRSDVFLFSGCGGPSTPKEGDQTSRGKHPQKEEHNNAQTVAPEVMGSVAFSALLFLLIF